MEVPWCWCLLHCQAMIPSPQEQGDAGIVRSDCTTTTREDDLHQVKGMHGVLTQGFQGSTCLGLRMLHHHQH